MPKAPPNRKTKAAAFRKTSRLRIQVTATQRDKILDYCESIDTPLSLWARKLLLREVEKEKTT